MSSVPAHADDGIKLTLDNFFRTAIPGGTGGERVGPQYAASDISCAVAPSGSNDFDALSQAGIIDNGGHGWLVEPCSTTDALRNAGGVGGESIVYLSPSFGRFQLSLSWGPNNARETASLSSGKAGAQAPLPEGQRNVVDVYAEYSRDFGKWSLGWGGGGRWTLGDDHGTPANDKSQTYQSGLNLTFGNFSVGGSGQYYRNGMWPSQDIWVVGGGAAYRMDAWTFGLQYNYGDFQFVGQNVDGRINAVVATGQYEMGAGIALDAMVEFGWVKADKANSSANDYQTYGIGIGTSFQF